MDKIACTVPQIMVIHKAVENPEDRHILVSMRNAYEKVGKTLVGPLKIRKMEIYGEGACIYQIAVTALDDCQFPGQLYYNDSDNFSGTAVVTRYLTPKSRSIDIWDMTTVQPPQSVQVAYRFSPSAFEHFCHLIHTEILPNEPTTR